MNGVVGWFEARGEIPLVPPPRLRDYCPLSDDPERPHETVSGDPTRGLAFALEYCDSRGWASTRTVRCLGLDPGPPSYLQAYCNVRGTSRSFRIDRIISIMDLRSGRILAGDEHVALLAPYLQSGSADPSVAAMQGLHNVARDGVFALLQLGMPEGRLDDNARAIVLDYVRAEADTGRVPLPPSQRVELWIDNLAPPLDAVTDAVHRMLAEKDKFVRLLPWLLKLVRTRDDFAAQEQSVRELIAEVRLHFRRKMLDWPAHSRAI
jgi:hypothetical protein